MRERKEKKRKEKSVQVFRRSCLRGRREYSGRDPVRPGYGRFCADILSYEIADIHRISIEMAADVAAAIARPRETRPRLDAPLVCVVAPSRQARLDRPADPAILYQFSSFAAITLL